MKLLSLFNPKKNNQFTRNSERPYKIFLIVISVVYLFIFGSHILSPNQNKYLAPDNGDVIQTEGLGTFKVIERNYDKASNKYQVVLWLVSDSSVKDDYQLEMKASSIVESDISSPKNSEVVRIGRQYFSIVVSDVPDNYGAIRTDITVEKNAISDEQMSEGSVKLYSKESQTDSSTIEIATEFYELQERKIHVSELNIEANAIKKENKKIEKEIKRVEQLQEDIRQDLLLQVGEEKENSKKAIEEYQVDIASKNNQIEVNDQLLLELKEKIDLINSQK